MSQQPKQPIPEQQVEQNGNRARPTPETDPTNPMHQEAVGIRVPAEQKEDEAVAESVARAF